MGRNKIFTNERITIIMTIITLKTLKPATTDLARFAVNITADGKIKTTDGVVQAKALHLGRFFMSLAKGKDNAEGMPTYWLRAPYNSTTKKKVVDLDSKVQAAILDELLAYVEDGVCTLAEGAEIQVEIPLDVVSPWVYVNPLKNISANSQRRAMATISVANLVSIQDCMVNEGSDGLWLAMPYWVTAQGERQNYVQVNKNVEVEGKKVPNIFYSAIHDGAVAGYKAKMKAAATPADTDAEATA